MPVKNFGADNEIIAALKNKSTINDALSFLYNSYYEMLENYVVNNGGSADDASDTIQETMIAFTDAVQQDKYRSDASVKSYLYAIARNLWHTELRKRGNAANRNIKYEMQNDKTSEDVSKLIVRAENNRIIGRLFENMEEKCRKLLLFVYYEGLSMKEILPQMPGYDNEQVLRNKKHKCMKHLLSLIEGNEQLKSSIKNALTNG